jgi:hypothetical protein
LVTNEHAHATIDDGILPCSGCAVAVASMRHADGGLSISQSQRDGCFVVRMGGAEKLRSDDPCLACTYFRNRADRG